MPRETSRPPKRGNVAARWVLPHVCASYAGFLAGFLVQWATQGNSVPADGVILMRVCFAPLIAPVLMPFVTFAVIFLAESPKWAAMAFIAAHWIGYVYVFVRSRPVFERWDARRGRRYPPDRCGRCGYDLRRSEGRCPECGTVIGLD